MKVRSIFYACSALLLLILSALPCSADDKLQLPKTVGNWKIGEDIQVYEGDDLYLYINGGAELYHEYGFLHVTATDYFKGEDSIAVEVYRLKSSAFGLYSLLRDAGSKKVDVGQGGSFSDYYLLFWQGNDLVAITAHSDKANDENALTDIARNIVPALSKNAEIPAYINILPQKGLQQDSIKYLAGSIGLLNNYPGLARYFFEFSKGVSGKYADGSSVLILTWESPQAAEAALNKAIEITAKPENSRDSICNNKGEITLTLGKTVLKATLKNESIVFKK